MGARLLVNAKLLFSFSPDLGNGRKCAVSGKGTRKFTFYAPDELKSKTKMKEKKRKRKKAQWPEGARPRRTVWCFVLFCFVCLSGDRRE